MSTFTLPAAPGRHPLACRAVQWLLIWALLLLPASALHAQFTYTKANGGITITGVPMLLPDTVSIPDTIDGLPVTAIGDGAFQLQLLMKSVTIPNTVTTIGAGAFEWCYPLTNVSIPESVTFIGQFAFFGCFSLSSVVIPRRVTTIGDNAFGECWGLREISVAGDNPSYSSLGGVLFDKGQTVLLQYPASKPGDSYTVPDGVISIYRGAFDHSGLTAVRMSDSVTTIWDDAFRSCSNLKTVRFGNSLTTIRREAFLYCSSLTSLRFPASTVSIGDEAFYSCTNLYSAYFMGDAPDMGASMFALCPTTVYYMQGTRDWEATYAERPTVTWNPSTRGTAFQDGFVVYKITGAAGAIAVVEACDNLTNPVWLPVSTNTLTGGSSLFSDTISDTHPSRFYRFRSP